MSIYIGVFFEDAGIHYVYIYILCVCMYLLYSCIIFKAVIVSDIRIVLQ